MEQYIKCRVTPQGGNAAGQTVTSSDSPERKKEMFLFEYDGEKYYDTNTTKAQMAWKIRDQQRTINRMYKENEETKATLKEFSDKLCAVIAYIVDTYGEEAAHVALSYQEGE